jgi:hypothetical protein
MAMQRKTEASVNGATQPPLQVNDANTLLHNEFCYGCMDKRGWPFDPQVAKNTRAIQFVSLNAMR